MAEIWRIWKLLNTYYFILITSNFSNYVYRDCQKQAQ